MAILPHIPMRLITQRRVGKRAYPQRVILQMPPDKPVIPVLIRIDNGGNPLRPQQCEHISQFPQYVRGAESVGITPFFKVDGRGKIEIPAAQGTQKVLPLHLAVGIEAEKMISPCGNPRLFETCHVAHIVAVDEIRPFGSLDIGKIKSLHPEPVKINVPVMG